MPQQKKLLSLRNRDQTELLFSILLETDRCQAFDCRRRAPPDRKFSTRNIRRTQRRVRTFPSPDILNILSWRAWPRPRQERTAQPTSLRDLKRGRTPVHADMTRLLSHSLEPAAHGWKAGEIKTALVGDMREGIKGNVGDGVAAGGKEAVIFKVLFHHAQSLVALLHPLLDGMHLQFLPALDEHQPEMGGAQIRLEAVLFKEHPLQHFAALEPIFRHKRRTAGEVPKDRARFRNIAPGRGFEQWYVPARVLGEELRCTCFARKDVDLHQVIVDSELRERKSHLVAIAGALHRIEREHCRVPVFSTLPRLRFLGAFRTRHDLEAREEIARRMRPQCCLSP